VPSLAPGRLSLLLGMKPKVGARQDWGVPDGVTPAMQTSTQDEPSKAMSEQVNLMKNIALICGLTGSGGSRSRGESSRWKTIEAHPAI